MCSFGSFFFSLQQQVLEALAVNCAPLTHMHIINAFYCVQLQEDTEKVKDIVIRICILFLQVADGNVHGFEQLENPSLALKISLCSDLSKISGYHHRLRLPRKSARTPNPSGRSGPVFKMIPAGETF